VEDTELTIFVGDVVIVEEDNESGWCLATKQLNGVDKSGWIPTDYVEKIGDYIENIPEPPPEEPKVEPKVEVFKQPEPEPPKVEPVKVEPVKVEPVKVEPVKAEPKSDSGFHKPVANYSQPQAEKQEGKANSAASLQAVEHMEAAGQISLS